MIGDTETRLVLPFFTLLGRFLFLTFDLLYRQPKIKVLLSGTQTAETSNLTRWGVGLTFGFIKDTRLKHETGRAKDFRVNL